VFLRPYHLCHLETTRAIALAAMYDKAVINLRAGRVTDTYAYAQKDLVAGDVVSHAIGSNEVYGQIDETAKADAANHVPQGILDIEGQPERPVMKRAVAKDQPILMDDVDIPSNRMTDLWEQQKPLVGLG